MEHFYVKFGDFSCSGFTDIMPKTDRQRDAQTDNIAEKPYPCDYRRRVLK